MHAEFWLESVQARVDLKDVDRWENNIKIDLQQIWRNGVDYSHFGSG
jgi:hypothetical protein